MGFLPKGIRQDFGGMVMFGFHIHWLRTGVKIPDRQQGPFLLQGIHLVAKRVVTSASSNMDIKDSPCGFGFRQ